jgi:metallo-beta-lactamase class B
LDFEAGQMRFLVPGQLDVAQWGKAYRMILSAVGNSEGEYVRPFVPCGSLIDGEGTTLLIDTGYEGKDESILLPQFAKVGLKPEDIKVVVLTHGHGDHYGGTRYLQDHYKGLHVYLSAPDWDFVAEQRGSPESKPIKDMVMKEGENITFGGETVTPVFQPGHTPGTMSLIFPVYDNGKKHMALLMGAVQITPAGLTSDGFDKLAVSTQHVADIAKQMHVDVELANHPIWDGSPEKMAMFATRGPR